MALIDDIPKIVELIDKEKIKDLIDHNDELFQIFEGDLLTFVLKEIEDQLGGRSAVVAKKRVIPINVLRRIVLKLSKLYAEPPIRKTENETDKELVLFYERSMMINSFMGDSNEFFNLFKNTAIEPFVHEGKPKLRVIPSNQFLVMSTDKVNPQNMTHFIKFMGDKFIQLDKNEDPELVSLFAVFTDEEILIIDQKGRIRTEEMLDNEEGVNPFGKIPFIYINKSRHNLIPLPDTDFLKMTKAIPVLLSDLSFAIMFQAFSILWGIDIDSENLEMSPSSFWSLKSDPASDKKPEIGSIKPEVSIQDVLGYTVSVMGLWLESRNIKPGAVGNLSADQAASGVSLMIQNMDTTEDKKMQISFFKEAENDLWDLIAKNMHPVWVQGGLIEERRLFSNDFEIAVIFKDPKPVLTKKEIRDEQVELLNEGLTTKKRAIKAIDPEMSEDEVNALVVEIEQDDFVVLTETKETDGN